MCNKLCCGRGGWQELKDLGSKRSKLFGGHAFESLLRFEFVTWWGF